MSEEQEKKLDQMLEAVARRFEVGAPDDLPAKIEEALNQEKPRPLFRAWQPAFALIIVGIFSGVLYDRMRREGLAPQADLSQVKESPKAPQAEGRPEPELTTKRAGITERRSTVDPVPAGTRSEDISFVPDPGTELQASPDKRRETMLVYEVKRDFSGKSVSSTRIAVSPERSLYKKAAASGPDVYDGQGATPYLISPEVRDGQGAKPYLIGEQASPAPASRAADSGEKIAVLPPSYGEFMSYAGQNLQAGNLEGAHTYWNAALEIMSTETSALPRASDIRRCRAWLSLDRTDPVLRWLKELEKRQALSLSSEKVKTWVSLLEKGEVLALDQEFESLLERQAQP